MSALRATPAARVSMHQVLALMVLVLPTIVVALNGTVLTFALPVISAELDPSAAEVLWMIDVYPLVLASLLITMGVLGDRFGRRRLLAIGAGGFALMSVLAAFSPSVEVLILARAVSAVFGAMLMPPTLALLRVVFPDRVQRRTAVAVWATGFSAGGALGPVVSGFLLEHYWWGSALLVSVPVCLLVLVGSVLLPSSRSSEPGALEPLSVALSVLALAASVHGLKAVATGAPAIEAGVALLVGGLAGWLFVRRQRRLTVPLLDLELFRSRVFSTSVVSNMLSISALTGLLLFSSQYFQLVVGLGPLESALHLLPSMLFTITAGLLAARLARRYPLHVLVPIGLLGSASGYLLASQLGVGSGTVMLVAAACLVGAGTGLAETLTNDAILASAPPARSGAASAVSETAYELGVVLGTAVLGSVLTGVYRSALFSRDLPLVADGAQRAAGETLGGALEVAGALNPGASEQLRLAAQESFLGALDVTALVGSLVVLTACVLTAVVLRRAREEVVLHDDAPTDPDVPDALRPTAPGAATTAQHTAAGALTRAVEGSSRPHNS